MARHPRPPSPTPPPAPPDPEVGFDPVEEWLLDFDFDFEQAMASELAKSFGLGDPEEAPAVLEPTGCYAGVPVPEGGSVSESCGVGVKLVKKEVVEEKGEPLGLLGASCGSEFDIKIDPVTLSGELEVQLGPDQPVPGISDFAVKGDTLEGVVDADMSTVATDMSIVAAVDTEMDPEVSVKEVVGGEGGNGDEERKEDESKSSEGEEEEESSGTTSSSDEEEQRANKDEESSEASSSGEEEEQRAKKHVGVDDMEALLEEGEMMVAMDDDNDEEAPKGSIKFKHEVEVLPPVPKIQVQLEPHHKALPVGTISAIMGERLIVEGSVQHSPLNEGSILWITESRTPLGIVDELFGPVKNPYYLVRYNSAEEVPAGICAGTTVSFVVEFADHILNMKELYAKGYDESADNDEDQSDEPEFSDDEKEAEYKRSLRLAKRQSDRQHESKKPSGDKKRGQPRSAGFRKDMPPRIHDAPALGHQSQHRFHRSDMAPAVADSATHQSGPQNSPMSAPRKDMPPRIHDAHKPDHRAQHRFHLSDMAPAVADSATRPSGPPIFPMSAPTMLPPISMNHAMPSAVQLANQMGGCFINPSQQFSLQQPNMVWPGGFPPPPHPNMGMDGAALAANIMQNILIGANQYQQYLQNQNFGGFPNGMPPQFMPGGGMPPNPMPFGGPPVNNPFGPSSQLPMGQGNFVQLPHMAGNQGQPPGFPCTQGFGGFPSPHGDPRIGDQPPGFPNTQGYGRLPSPHGDGDQSPMQFNSGQFNQGNSSFRGRRPHQRGGRHSPGRGGGGRHRK